MFLGAPNSFSYPDVDPTPHAINYRMVICKITERHGHLHVRILQWVIPSILLELSCKIYAAVFSFIAGVMPPMPASIGLEPIAPKSRWVSQCCKSRAILSPGFGPAQSFQRCIGSTVCREGCGCIARLKWSGFLGQYCRLTKIHPASGYSNYFREQHWRCLRHRGECACDHQTSSM